MRCAVSPIKIEALLEWVATASNAGPMTFTEQLAADAAAHRLRQWRQYLPDLLDTVAVQQRALHRLAPDRRRRPSK